MILKGQNFRFLYREPIGGNEGYFHVFAKSTSGTVTLTGNTDDASHKDVTGLSSAPVVVSKGWSVAVDALEVLDYEKFLNAVNNCTPIVVEWDETRAPDNQAPAEETFARRGSAYINDFTLVFNDREIATKNIQLTGTSELIKPESAYDYETIVVSDTFVKGESVRLFLEVLTPDHVTGVVAAAKQLSFHVSVSLESATSKDTTGDWDIQEPTAINFDISTTALIKSGETITSQVAGFSLANIEDMFEASAPINFQIARVSGANNRTKGDTLISGKVIFTQLTLNGPNRANADYSAQMQGYGPFVIPVSNPSNDLPDSGNL